MFPFSNPDIFPSKFYMWPTLLLLSFVFFSYFLLKKFTGTYVSC